MSMTDTNNAIPAQKAGFGKWVLLAFIAFFALIVAVNSVFIYQALNSFNGVIVDDPYKKGLSYNDTLAAARAQPEMQDRVVFEGGMLRWYLMDESAVPVKHAVVQARLIRPVREGFDFDVVLHHKGNGIYERTLDFPLKGRWTAKLKATWNNGTKQYQTMHEIIAQ